MNRLWVRLSLMIAAVLFLVFFLAICLVLTRIIAEAGLLMVQFSFRPVDYLMLFGGLGGQLMEDGMYFWLKTDESGQKLKGDTSFVVHLDKDKIPKTKAFWSLTLYNKDFYLPKGMPLDRHVRNSNSGMKLNADGSLDIYLQPDNPGPGKVDNWLPTPRGEEYFCVMRIYWPKTEAPSILPPGEGTWQPPGLVKVK